MTVAIATLLCLLLIPAPVPASLDKPETILLPNGLRVIIKKDSSSPLVALQTWIETGSADEYPEEAGLAHLVEHILFRGSGESGTGKLVGEIESLGGRMNGFTSRDHTVYHMVLPAPGFRQGLNLLSQMMRLPTLSESELQKEIQVVLEEWKQAEDNPRSRASSALFRTVYPIHPYGRPVIGDPETLRRLKWEQVRRFYSRWYSADNMILVVVGDIDKDEVRSSIESLFLSLARSTPPARPRPLEPLQKRSRLQIVRTSFRQPRVMIGFPSTATQKDAPVLDLIAFILGRGESSRLAKKIKIATGLVHSISASAFSSKELGLFSIEAELEAEKITDALKAILKEVYSLRDEWVQSSELERARINFERSFIETRETVQGQANEFGRFLSVFRDPSYAEAYLEQIRTISPEQIKSAAQRFFTTERLSVVLVVPEDTTELPDDDRLRDLSFSMESTPATPRPLDAYVFRTLDNGVRIFVQEDHRLPAFTVHAGVVGGLLLENEATNGIHNFIAAMLTQGTSSLNSSKLADRVEQLGGRLDASAGNGMLSLTGSFPSSQPVRGMEIFLDALLDPTFPESEFERKRQDILIQIRNQEERGSRQAFRLFYQKLFHSHPYRFDPLGQQDRVRKFSREDLLAHYQRLVSPDKIVISVVGAVDGEEILKSLERRLSTLPRRADDFFPPPPEDAVKQVFVEKKIAKSKQSHLVLGFAAPTRLHPDYFAMKILQTTLSGIGGRLFVRLRDQQGLAYSVSSFSLDDRHQGAFGIYAATDPASVEKMKEEMQAEIRRVQEEEIGPGELERAKKSLIGNYLISRQTNAARAAALTYNELFGLGSDFARRYQEGIEKVTAGDVLRFARTHLPLDRYVLVIVGP